jgi:hypothetical protein
VCELQGALIRGLIAIVVVFERYSKVLGADPCLVSFVEH